MSLAERFVYPWLVPAVYRFARLVTRRQPPDYRGWQDFELGTYVTDPAPVERRPIPSVGYVALDEILGLQPWQEDTLRVYSARVRERMLQEHRRPQDARITIHGPKKVTGLTAFGIPVVVDPAIPLLRVDVELLDRFPRIRTIHTPLPDGGWSIEEVNEDADQMITDFKNQQGIR